MKSVKNPHQKVNSCHSAILCSSKQQRHPKKTTIEAFNCENSQCQKKPDADPVSTLKEQKKLPIPCKKQESFKNKGFVFLLWKQRQKQLAKARKYFFFKEHCCKNEVWSIGVICQKEVTEESVSEEDHLAVV